MDWECTTMLSASTEKPKKKAKVVGLYGIPGCGKTFLLHHLRQKFKGEALKFYEGSDMIATVVPSGITAFQEMEELEKRHWRRLAIDTIEKECAESGDVGVVAGHFMFWAQGEEAGLPVYTQNDLDTFTHILYLNIPAEVVHRRRLDDTERVRSPASIAHLRNWQHAEMTQLRDLCRQNGILFSTVAPRLGILEQISRLLDNFYRDDENNNLYEVEDRLDKVLADGRDQLETVLVLDGDRTLVEEDTGELFWQRVSDSQRLGDGDSPLKRLFGGPLGYSYTAFRQAALLYEEATDEKEFDEICHEVASVVNIHPEFVSLLRMVELKEYTRAIVVTCGLRRVWEKVLERSGLSESVKVIGGGRISDSSVITAAVKAALVVRLQDLHRVYVWVFGDSVLDLEMLGKADQAIVVVCQEHTRSKTMDPALEDAIDNRGLRARQLVLPSHASPRLDTTKLLLVRLTDHEFVASILCNPDRTAHIQVHHATERNAAKVLMTPMRDVNVAGSALREAHRRVGWYLATEFLPSVIGIEEYPIVHVQGHDTSGYRLTHEKQTSIVALMRGGEAMAFGVNEAFPLAMFVHANGPQDVMLHHLQRQHTVVLVDSVINNGTTVLNFMQHIRHLHATIRIVVVVGVVQAKSIGNISQALGRSAKLSLVALRLSENKFIGSGTTDTGNRLFNTTHLA